jgi:hypothetical protein
MQRTYPAPASQYPQQPVKPRRRNDPVTMILIAFAAVSALVVVTVLALIMGLVVFYASGRILPGVSAAGIAVRGYTLAEATGVLAASWSEIKIRDGKREWVVPTADLGLTLDASATALAAQRFGRTDGSMITALIGHAQVAPVLNVDPAVFQASLRTFAPTADKPAENATIRMVNGQLKPVPPVDGRMVDVDATINTLLANPGHELADGALDLVMLTMPPTVTDATPLLERTRTLAVGFAADDQRLRSDHESIGLVVCRA